MKRTLFLALVVSTAAPLFLSACGDEPQRPVVVNHYHTRVVHRDRDTTTTTVNDARGNGSPESFRAVERPQ